MVALAATAGGPALIASVVLVTGVASEVGGPRWDAFWLTSCGGSGRWGMPIEQRPTPAFL